MSYTAQKRITSRQGPLWAELERYLASVAQRCTESVSTCEFLRETLAGAAQWMASPAAIAWLREPGGGFEVAAVYSDDEPLDFQSPQWQRLHRRLLAQLSTHQTVLLCAADRYTSRAAGDVTDLHAGVGDPHDGWILLAAVLVESKVEAALEFVLAPESPPEARLAFTRFVEGLCALTGDHLRATQLNALRHALSGCTRRESLVRQLHSTLASTHIAYALANEGRELAGWDRLSVVLRRGERTRLAAVSGAGGVERLGHGVQVLEQLARAVMLDGQPLHFDGSATELPPQLDDLLRHHLDQTHAQSVAVVPITRPQLPPSDGAPNQRQTDPEVLGALVAENFRSGEPTDALVSLDWLASASAGALANAAEHEAVPYAHAWRRWRNRLPRQRKHWLLALAAACAAVTVALLAVPAHLHIPATGELWPSDRRHVYATSDGIVEHVNVTHGQHVTVGERLGVMRNAKLEADIEALLTKLRAAEAERDAVATSLIERTVTGDDVRMQEHLLGARKHALQREVQALQQQLALLQQQHERLELRSPLSGQVITWDTQQRLLDRPVQHGDALLTVVNPDSPWIIELRVPDRRIGHVITADSSPGGLGVRFVTALDSRTVYEGRVTELAVAAEHDEERGSTVRVIAAVDRRAIARPVPGAEVFAKIDCGKRCLGFVLFHGLIDAVRTKLLL